MPRKRVEPLPKVQCDGPGVNAFGDPNPAERCQNMVTQTKPSRTGRHYCPARHCQTARARQYRRDAAEPSRRQERIWELMFTHDAANKGRVECPGCHLENAIPGWPHRDPSRGPCRELVTVQDGRRIAVDFIDAVWPHPVYSDGVL